MSNNYGNKSDKELVRLLGKDKRQSEAAFTEIYQRYSSMVNAYCLRVLGNEEQAEDIFQDTFINFYKNIDTKAEYVNVPGYLITIARNKCLNIKRNRKQTVQIENVEFTYTDSQNYEQKELLDLINTSLDLLSDDYRDAFVMREYSGMQYSEIANVLNISVNNAKSRVFRARKKIKEILMPYLKDISKL